MKATVMKGQVTYLDTEQGIVHITDKVDDEAVAVYSTPDTQLPQSLNWEDLIGQEVEAIVINDKAKEIYLIEE